jgi:hypothetical protein
MQSFDWFDDNVACHTTCSILGPIFEGQTAAAPNYILRQMVLQSLPHMVTSTHNPGDLL